MRTIHFAMTLITKQGPNVMSSNGLFYDSRERVRLQASQSVVENFLHGWRSGPVIIATLPPSPYPSPLSGTQD